jgi:hypothetical protein
MQKDLDVRDPFASQLAIRFYFKDLLMFSSSNAPYVSMFLSLPPYDHVWIAENTITNGVN